jgi:hypothetical protein
MTATGKTITVNVTISITLDSSAWSDYHGLDPKAKVRDIRADVRSHVLHMVQCSEFLGEADAITTLKG